MNTELDTLYLDGTHISSNFGVAFKHSTQTVLLIAAYCKNVNLDLCLVVDEESDQFVEDATSDAELLNSSTSTGFRIPKDSFLNVMTKRHAAIPDEVKNCRFPVIHMPRQAYVVCGLCHVLRQIVKLTSKHDSPDLVRLLGLKQCCLKASSEISSRTKLCETLAPVVVDEWIRTASALEISDMPEVVTSVESLLRAPVKMHNMDKQQRRIMQRLGEITENESQPKRAKMTNCLKKVVVKTKDLPPLKHVFMEGVEFMLSDLAILPALDAFLKVKKSGLQELRATIPLTLQWYTRVAKLCAVDTAVKACGVEWLDVGEHTISSLVSDESRVLELGKDQERVNAEQKNGMKTLRRDLPSTVEHFEKHVQLTYMQFPPDELRIDWSALPESIHPIKGELSAPRATRKCQQLENIICAVKTVCAEEDVIVDFCCGGGHVGIALAHLLPSCKVILIDNKEESLDRARVRAHELNLKNITIYQCNLEHFRGEFGIGVALHACGVATDMVMHECIEKKASFVISPCCYGRIQNLPKISYPQSKFFQNIPCEFDDMLLLGRAGDQTSWNFESAKAKQGKHCMGLLDTDRILAASDRGYKCHLLSLTPHTCSPKNNLLLGVAPGTDRQVDHLQRCSL